MKMIFFFLLLISVRSLFAQSDSVITFYNRKGEISSAESAVKFGLQVKENDHYKKLMVDLKDNKVQSIAYFSDVDCKYYDGPYKEIYKNGKIQTTGRYYQNKKTGLWKTYTDSGKLTDSITYLDGYIHGLGLRWNAEQKITDSLIFEEGGKGVNHGYWSDGKLRERGSYMAGKKDGQWTYYFKNGNKCQDVQYAADSAIAYTCYDEQGNVQQKNCIYEQEAEFPGGEKGWLRYLTDNLGNVKLPDEYYKGNIYGTVWIQFIVEIDGSVSGMKVVDAVDPGLDEVALNIIRRSPRWKYAIQYNRPVRAYRLQPITFSKAE
jgi:antitoxin component YwqK of YwqJK toxin-antitoxin module